MKPIISLSTSNLMRRIDGSMSDILYKVAELGFEYVELGHSIPVVACEEIFDCLNKNVIKVSSCHNFCPLPPYAAGPSPNLFSPSTSSIIESKSWIRHTKNSVNFASAVNAKALVCHCGSLTHFFKPLDSEILKFYETHSSDELVDHLPFELVKKPFIKKSAKRALTQYKYLKKNLETIKELLVEKGIKIGIENREGVSEIPLDWNVEELFKKTDDLGFVYAWIDTGHIMRKKQMHLIDPEEYVEKFSERIIGWHIQDCDANGRDHIALGKGVIDFKKLSKFFDAEKQIFVLELNHRVKDDDVKDSLKRLQDLL